MKLSLMLALALTLLSSFAAPVQPVARAATSTTAGDLAGIYECEGTTIDGTPYRGTVQIARNNGTYQLLWTLGSREHYLGFGIVSDNVLAVSVVGNVPGVVAYRIESGDKGPRLVGQWAVPDAKGQVFVETLRRLPTDASQPRAVEPPLGDPQRTEPPREKVRKTRDARRA